mgnify:CR=1 FL=1
MKKMKRAWEVKAKVDRQSISFQETDDTYANEGRLSGVLFVGDKRCVGFFEYTERSGFGWSFVGACQKALVDLNDRSMSGRLSAKGERAFERFTTRVVDRIQKKTAAL